MPCRRFAHARTTAAHVYVRRARVTGVSLTVLMPVWAVAVARRAQLLPTAVFFVHNNSGDAFVKLQHLAEVDEAVKLHRHNIGRRYIEVFRSTVEEAAEAQNRAAQSGHDDGEYTGVVRMRGLPWSTTAQQVREFFGGLQITSDGVQITLTREGRPSGEAYVVFKSEDEMRRALTKDKEKIGERWIDIFPATKGEMYSVANASRGHGALMAGGGGELPTPLDMADAEMQRVLKMRGLPYEATKADVQGFFAE